MAALLASAAPGAALALASPCDAACSVAQGAAQAVDAMAPLPTPPVAAPTVVVDTVEQTARVAQPVSSSLPMLVDAPPQAFRSLAPTSPDDAAAVTADVAPVNAPLAARSAPMVDAPLVAPVAAPPIPATGAFPLPALPELAALPAPALAPDAPSLPPEAAAVATASLAMLLGGALYVRLAPGALLESPTRQRVLAFLRGDPGATVGTVARALGLDYKTAQHHLRILRHAGFVAIVRSGRLDRYFVAGDLPPERMRAALVLRSPAARALAQALEAQRARAADLARSLNLSEATASVQLRRLEAAGLVQKGADGLWAAA
jgi:DNA-binding transcriptional ArsR family regulator